MSVAVAVYETAAPVGPVASTTLFAGRVSVGGVVSTTVIVNEPLALLPLASVAVQLTVVAPSANVLPEAAQVTAGCGSTLSVAVTV